LLPIPGLATPSFWLGIVFILAMLVVFKWLPPMVYTPFWVNPWQNLAQLIWPALAVGYRYSAVATGVTPPAFLGGLWEASLRIGCLLGGVVVTEQVFNLNGLGLLFVQAVAHRDYTLIQALVMLVSGFFIVVNFFMDVVYAYVDPRIRYR